jgi:hypothetical protein
MRSDIAGPVPTYGDSSQGPDWQRDARRYAGVEPVIGVSRSGTRGSRGVLFRDGKQDQASTAEALVKQGGAAAPQTRMVRVGVRTERRRMPSPLTVEGQGEVAFWRVVPAELGAYVAGVKPALHLTARYKT